MTQRVRSSAFNLGPCCVTVGVYKCTVVVRNDTRTQSLDLRGLDVPSLGMGRPLYTTFVNFFAKLWTSPDRGACSAEVRLSSSVVIGSLRRGEGPHEGTRDVFS